MAGSGPGGGSRDGHILMKLGNIRDELDRLNRQQKTTVEKAQKLVYSEKDIQRARHAALTEAIEVVQVEASNHCNGLRCTGDLEHFIDCDGRSAYVASLTLLGFRDGEGEKT